MSAKRAREEVEVETIELLKSAALFEQWATLNEEAIKETYMDWINNPNDIENKNLRKQTVSDEEESNYFKLLWRPFVLPYLTMGYAFEFNNTEVSKAIALPKYSVDLWERFRLITQVVKHLEEEKENLPAP
jgi:hypothetical protein